MAVFGGAVLLACAAAGALSAWSHPEHWEYSVIAQHWLDGDGAVYPFLDSNYYLYGSWLYPRLLGVVLRLSGGREAWMVALQAIFAGGTTSIVYLLARDAFGRREGLMAALLVGTHPGTLVYAGKLHPQLLDGLLVTLAFAAVLHVSTTPRAWPAALAGATVGLAMLTRGTIAPFLVAWAIWFVAAQRVPVSRAVAILGILFAATAGVVSPVVLESYARYGRLVPLRTDTGVNLWIGNHAGATGTSFTNDMPPVPVLARLPDTLRARLAGRSDAEQHEVLSLAVRDFIRSDPAAAASLLARKWGYF